MSNIEAKKNVEQIVRAVQPDFEALARIHGVVNFKEEASFALQLLADNEYLMRVAIGNPDSLKRAVLNVAIIGLSLNPYKREAYLVPRKSGGVVKICLDISYIGYVKLATDEGAIRDAIPELVKEHDEFEFRGPHQMPIHKFDPFGDRGRIKGGYVMARLPGNGLLVTHMTLERIFEIRDRTDSWKAHKSKGSHSIWQSDSEEMIKKTLIRNARKSWPKGVSSNRLAKATEIIEEADPVLLAPAPDTENIERADLLLKIREGLKVLGRSEDTYISYLKRINRRDLKALDEMTTLEMKQSLTVLNQLVDQQAAKEKK